MTSELPPLMRQYLEIKGQYKDALLFFRVGDFYEMFYDDAKTASKILDIALTTRDKNKREAVPLCGIPYHAASPYIAKLIRAGKKVAICEQVEDPKKVRLQPGGGIVKREVLRVITPGTVTEPDLLEAKEPFYIASLWISEDRRSPAQAPDRPERSIGLAYLDLSTGEFRTTQFQDPDHASRVIHELTYIEPRELLLPESLQDDTHQGLQNGLQPWPTQYIADWQFSSDLAEQLLCSHLGVRTLDGYGLKGQSLAIGAAGVLLRYVMDNQKGSIGNITSLKWHGLQDYMILDPLTQKNLDLVRRAVDGKTSEKREGQEKTLLGVLDQTQTPMGARLLRQWLLRPLLDLAQAERRLDAVEMLLEAYQTRTELQSALSHVYDVERLIGRISLGTANARDLILLKKSLKGLPEIRKLLSPCQDSLIQDSLQQWDDLQDIYRVIEETLVQDPPSQLREGGLIKEGADPQLDELRALARDGKGWIARLEAQEKERTGIDSLKIRYNQIFGYYIEITKTRLHAVPQDYIRKQTLLNAERFTTPELKTLEQKVLDAEGRLEEMEYRLFDEARSRVSRETPRIQTMACHLAMLDALTALAEVAHRNHYVRPRLTEEREIRIVDGRHPVLERVAAREGFVPNDTLLDNMENRFLVITGPNMAGKSTYMRQVALIVLMAQMGGFVPARKATIGLTDRIFTRVGAADDLTGGAQHLHGGDE